MGVVNPGQPRRQQQPDIEEGLTLPRPTRSNNDNMGGLTGVMPEQGYSDKGGDRSSNYFLPFSIREL